MPAHPFLPGQKVRACPRWSLPVKLGGGMTHHEDSLWRNILDTIPSFLHASCSHPPSSSSHSSLVLLHLAWHWQATLTEKMWLGSISLVLLLGFLTKILWLVLPTGRGCNALVSSLKKKLLNTDIIRKYITCLEGRSPSSSPYR